MILPKFPQSPRDPIRSTNKDRIRREDKQQITYPKKTVLDWRAYFINFCQQHGEPIDYGNVLLFQDGWRYAMEYEGPEYPPPSDHRELDILVMKYWLGRLRFCNLMLTKVIAERDRVINLMANKSLPLQQIVVVRDGNETRKGSMPLDTGPLEDRVKWLREDVADCEHALKEIERFYKEREHRG